MKFSFSKAAAIFLTLLAFVVVPGCLDIEEEVFINADGSGTYVNHVDMNGIVDMIMMMAPDSVKEEIGANPDMFLDSLFQSQEMTSSLAVMAERYEEQDGVSNAATTMVDGTMTISFDFASVESLNLALSQTAEENELGFLTPSFAWKKGRLTRLAGSSSDEMDEELQSQMEMMKMMMGDATYTTRYHFPGKVKSNTNQDASLLDAGKTVVVEHSLLEVMEDPTLLGNEIKFKKR